MTENKNTNTGLDLTPPAVKAEVGLLKVLIKKHFAKQGKDVLNVRSNYSNYFASSTSEHFSNGGGPVAYLRFAEATYADGTPVSSDDIVEAVGFAKSVLGDDCLPLSYVEDGKTVKILTAVLYNKDAARHRPSVLAVEADEKTETVA